MTRGVAAAGPDLPERLAYLGDAVAASAALAAAGRLGVLARLDRGPADTRALAADCGIDERGAARLLAALAGLGLVEPDRADPRARTWRSAVPRLAPLAGLHELWAGLPDTIRNGRPQVRGDTAAGAAAFYPAGVEYLGTLLAGAARRAASLLPPKVLPPGARVLDAGAGAAPWSLALADREPSCAITAADLPEVLEVTRGAAAAAGHAERYRYLPMDLFTGDLADLGFDLVIAGNLCHLFDAAANRRLLRRLAGCLRPGGTLAVIDVLPAGDWDAAPVALYELGLLLRSATGRVHGLESYRRWLAAAGLGPVACHPLHDRYPLVLMLAGAPPTAGP